MENYKTTNKNRDFEENYYSETAEGTFKYDQFSIRIMKWLCYADRHYYENVNYSVFMATFLTCPNEITYL